MLLRFRVSNYLSFREPQELSLVASSLKDRKDGLIACPQVPAGQVLPAALIYGANASGKSNLLSALGFLWSMVAFSYTTAKPGDTIPRHPFRLRPANIELPSRFELDFICSGTRFIYGFEVSNKAVEVEWLRSFPAGRSRLLFERTEQDFRFGRTLFGQNKIISNMTKQNSLFLSTAAQNGHPILTGLFLYILSFGGVTSLNIIVDLTSETSINRGVDARSIHFLEGINSGIVGFRRKKNKTADQSRSEFERLFDILKSSPDTDDNETTIELSHRSETGELIYFNMNEESAGTRRLLNALNRIFSSLDRGTVFVFDEIDVSLHTQATEALFALFCSPDTNPKGAQLIATTHDTNLLNSPLLRRDQIWFTEKDEGGATELYPLTDIRTRKADDIERAYLQGRYGAVPSDDLVVDLG